MKAAPLTVLFFCEHTVLQKARSGIQRVVIEAALALVKRADLRFVKWDAVDGQLRYLDKRDMQGLFPEGSGDTCRPHPACHRVSYRFGDTLEDPARTWLLMPEIPYFKPGGNTTFAKILSQCRSYGVRVASIFYDLIPVREPEYSAGRPQHLEYMIEMLRSDLVFPISHFSAQDLLAFIQESQVAEREMLDLLQRSVVAAPLGENREAEPWGLPLTQKTKQERPLLVMVGTVEPRKQQVRLLKILNDKKNQYPELQQLQVEIFGSLHPASSEALHKEIARNPRIAHHQYVPDSVIEDAYSRAWFSAFVSNHEGYGLPIVESLRRGVPCITASFGAMAEVAAGGGCLLVDVNDDGAIGQALLDIVRNPQLTVRLGREIAQRPRRSWGNYADQLVQVMETVSRQSDIEEREFIQTCSSQLASAAPTKSFLRTLHEVTWTIAPSGAAQAILSVDRSQGRAAAMLLSCERLDSHISKPMALAAANADVLACAASPDVEYLVAAAERYQISSLMPARMFAGQGALGNAMTAAIEVSRSRRAAFKVEQETKLSTAMRRRFAAELPSQPFPLSVVISTYNRAGFVEKNVEWILGLIDKDNLQVQCVVVDNASSDDSFDRLQRFVGHPKFALKRNANNVGMLGNLRVCSTASNTSYVWLVGDDDFIMPGALQRTLSALKAEPGLPLLFHNFGVYHREKIHPDDRPQQFQHELTVLAPNPTAEGVRRVNQIAVEHDNLFTAIYPIVFRADVLSECFNHPFDTIPFSNLTESVPTTQMILGPYRYAPAYWFAEPGIAGNAHNSWSAHRPRWHLVLMPMVLQLARDAGLSGEKVWQFLNVHQGLFEEAVGICIRNEMHAHIAVPGDTDFAYRNFRKKIQLDPRLATVSSPPPPHWSRPSD